VSVCELSIESEAVRFLADPGKYFGESSTAIHSGERSQIHELQRVALAIRFEEQFEHVPMVRKLAERQGIEHIERITDVVPMLFDHTMYKSYPVTLLERQQFDRLTTWLGRLTSVDLSGADVSDCASIDSWLSALSEQTELDLVHSSGTSGTMSFFPWSKRDHVVRCRVNRILALQDFGTEPTEQTLAEPFHFAIRANRLGGTYRADSITMQREGFNHTCLPRPSADLMWLAARLRYAVARGDATRVQVPASLLARRDEIEGVRATEDAAVQSWIAELEGLQGELLFWAIFAHDFYSVAAPRLAAGQRWTFAPGSVVMFTGGPKGRAIPDDWREIASRFLGARIRYGYGMSEMSSLQLMCEAGRYHLQPWIIPFVLEPSTSELRPSEGVQVGRFAYFDLLPESHWGGLITGDEVEVDFRGQCECGATTVHIGPEIARLSEKSGGDDKIMCTASPQAYDEAMDFLASY
jgi:hypothetical protein